MLWGLSTRVEADDSNLVAQILFHGLNFEVVAMRHKHSNKHPPVHSKMGHSGDLSLIQPDLANHLDIHGMSWAGIVSRLWGRRSQIAAEGGRDRSRKNGDRAALETGFDQFLDAFAQGSGSRDAGRVSETMCPVIETSRVCRYQN